MFDVTVLTLFTPSFVCFFDTPVAYPELVSGEVSKSHKFKGLVMIGASKRVIRVDKKSWAGGFPGNQN